MSEMPIDQLVEEAVPPLPTRDAYAAVTDAMQSAYDLLEDVNWQLGRVIDWHQKTGGIVAATLEDVGALWTFTDNVAVQIAQTRSVHDRNRNYLTSVGVMQRECERADDEARTHLESERS